MFGFSVELPPEPEGYGVHMPSHQPQLAEPENKPIEARPRPVRDAAGAIERVAVAIEEGRLHFVTTIATNETGKLTVDVRMVIDEAK